MKRRAFFGVAAGAVVAGPGMAKAAATQAAQSLSLGKIGGINTGGLNAVMDAAWQGGSPIGGFDSKANYGREILGKLMGLTREQRARLKAKHGSVSQLDPDIASYQSFSLSAKIEMQRERNIDALISERRSWWQKFVDGTPDDDNIDLW